MSTPSFDGINLTSAAAVQNYGAPSNRIFLGTVPGVIGAYTQSNPVGPRRITVTGIGTAVSAVSAATAFGDLQIAIIEVQKKQDVVGDYIGTDGVTRTDCILSSFTAGPITVGEDAGSATWTAVCQVQADIIHTVPSL